MRKFRDLIESERPILLFFKTEWNQQSNDDKDVVLEIHRELGDKMQTSMIDFDKNQELADALRIRMLPTVFIYQKGQMIYRNAGAVDKEKVLEVLNELTTK